MSSPSLMPDPARIPTDAVGAVEPASLREVAGWITHLARTLKTCRLYDASNPTVIRFREGLADDLRALLDRMGPLKLEVTSHDFVYEGHTVGNAKSREDELAGTFHRDGIRTITFLPGIESSELEGLLDQILSVTGPDAGDEDLVTLLWQAGLPSIQVTSVPLEGDADGGGGQGAEEASDLPWPRPAAGGVGPIAGEAQDPASTGASDVATRSDDWEVLARTGHLDRTMSDLERGIESEIARFHAEHETENATSVVQRSVEILSEAIASGATAGDRAELGAFLPRVLRETMAQGLWQSGRKALHLIHECDPSWSPEAFFGGFSGASTVVTRRSVAVLDQQDDAEIEAFLALAAESGPPATEWLMQILAESQQKRVRRPLARTIAALVRDNPERILPWMSDERWYVVRNVVHILGWIGGDGVVGCLKPASAHPELRVRREVVAALSEATPQAARPVLLSMLEGAESRVFTAILGPLALDTHSTVTERLVALLREEAFPQRTDEEKRAVYLALAGHGDAALPALEDELAGGGIFERGLEPHWQAVARCIARIGTPAALAALGRGTRSKRGGVRKACEAARASMEARHA